MNFYTEMMKLLSKSKWCVQQQQKWYKWIPHFVIQHRIRGLISAEFRKLERESFGTSVRYRESKLFLSERQKCYLRTQIPRYDRN